LWDTSAKLARRYLDSIYYECCISVYQEALYELYYLERHPFGL
jgi:hypothetical protein